MPTEEQIQKDHLEQGIILERLNNLISTNKKDHKLILDQVLKTNGNVQTNDKRIGKLESLKNKVIGGLIVVNLLILPLVIYYITQTINGA